MALQEQLQEEKLQKLLSEEKVSGLRERVAALEEKLCEMEGVLREKQNALLDSESNARENKNRAQKAKEKVVLKNQYLLFANDCSSFLILFVCLRLFVPGEGCFV